MTEGAGKPWPTVRELLAAARLRLRPIDVPEHPHLPADERAAFDRLIRPVRTLLEYGAGGSTVWASRFAKRIVSVDSDSRYLEAVGSRVDSSRCDFVPLHVPIGLTGPYGTPLVKAPTTSRIRRWSRYPTAPWDYFARSGEFPDLIFIDGRFRVACALECLMRLRPGSDTPLLLDDFRDRGHYGSIKPFIRDEELVGRLLVFRRPHDLDKEACRSAQRPFLADWR